MAIPWISILLYIINSILVKERKGKEETPLFKKKSTIIIVE